MALSSIGSIHSMVNMRKAAAAAPVAFNGNPYLISIGGVSTGLSNSTTKFYWGFVGGIGPSLIMTTFNGGGTGSIYYFSSNNGNSWTLPTVPVNTSSVVTNFRQCWVGFDGVHRIIVSNNLGIYVSNNSGTSWTTSNAADLRYQGAFVSTDGNLKLTANNNSAVYRIRNAPATLTFSGAGSTGGTLSRSGLVCSQSGQYVIQLSGTTNNVQFSNDYAGTWVNIFSRFSGMLTTAGISAGCMSADGQYIYVCQNPYRIWRSTNFGATFSPIHGTSPLFNISTYTTNAGYLVAVSYTGQYVVLNAWINQGTSPAAPNGYMFVSRDYGVTFSTPKLMPLTSPSTDPAFVGSIITHLANQTPVRVIALAYNQGVYYLDF